MTGQPISTSAGRDSGAGRVVTTAPSLARTEDPTSWQEGRLTIHTPQLNLNLNQFSTSNSTTGSSSSAHLPATAPRDAAPSRPANTKKRSTTSSASTPEVPNVTMALSGSRAGHANPKKARIEHEAPVGETQLRLTEDMYEGLASICVNVGQSIETLGDFFRLCQQSEEIAVGVIFSDLSHNMHTFSKKYCTPRSSCPRWYCTCSKHLRADRAVASIVGAVILVGGVAHFLPLAPVSQEINICAVTMAFNDNA